jgi:hypothetical protein
MGTRGMVSGPVFCPHGCPRGPAQQWGCGGDDDLRDVSRTIQRIGRRTATCRSHAAHPDLMANGWRCGKCEGLDVPAHSRHCHLSDEEEGVSLVDWSPLQQLRQRPDPRDDDASPGTPT